MYSLERARGVFAMWLAALALCAAATAAESAVDVANATQRVQRLVQQQLGVAANTLDHSKPLAALGMDELDLVELVMALEEEFDISIPDEAVEPAGRSWQDSVTTRRLVDIVVDQLRKKQKG